MQATTHGQALPRLAPRIALVTEVGFFALGVVIFTIIWVAGPWLWWLSAPVILVLGYGAAVLLASTTWVDESAGTLTRRGWRLWPVTVPLEAATSLRLATSGGGGARLTVQAGSASALVDLASVSLFASRSLPASTLTLLADVLDAHVPSDVRADVPRRLRAQAAHIARGGSVDTSPLSGSAKG